MEKLLNFIWRLILSPQERRLKTREYLYRKIHYYVKNTSPGGLPPWTFWEKVKIIGTVILMLGITFLIFLMLAFYKK